jgi:DNA repair protein RadD
LKTHSLAVLLEGYPGLSDLVDPTVRKAINLIGGLSVSELDLAGACLGNAYQVVNRLINAGLIPDSLSREAMQDLLQRLRVDDLHEVHLRSRTVELAEWLGLPAGIASSKTVFPGEAVATRPLFVHQRRAIREVRSHLEKGRTRVLVHMPTGAGKTRTTMNLICEWLRGREDGAVLWVASTSELCEQAATEFFQAWELLGNRAVPVIQGWGGAAWRPEDIRDGLVVVTPQTLHVRKVNSGPEYLSALGSRVHLIVFDEAHQAIAATYKSSVEQLAATGPRSRLTPVIGLSATPGRTLIGSDQDDELAEFFHHTKVTLDTSDSGDTNPVRHLISEGYLAEPHFELLTPPGTQGRAETTGYDGEVSYAAEDDVESALDPEDYLALVAKAVFDLSDQGHLRILVFAASVRLADQLAALLRATGVRAESIHGETPADLRAGMIARYKARTQSVRVLVNYGVLTTGFDAPMTSAAIIARPTRSLVLYSQMVGRAIRGKRAGGNDKATIVTVVDPGVEAFGNIAEAFLHWEDLWND